MIFAWAAAGAASTAAAASATVVFRVTAVLNTSERRLDRSDAQRRSAPADRNPGQDGLEDPERGPRAAVGADEARVPRVRRRRRVPVVQVDAADARAQRRQRAQDEARDLGGVRGALRKLDQRLVAARDQAAGLGEPDLALDELEQLLGTAGLEAVRGDVVVEAPVLRLAGDLDEALDPLVHALEVEQVGAEDAARGAGPLHRLVVARDELGMAAGLLAAEVGLVPGRVVADPRVTGAELLELSQVGGGARQLAALAGEHRAVEGDQRVDAVLASGVEPLLHAVGLALVLEDVPGDGEARVPDAKVEEAGVLEELRLLVGDADDGGLGGRDGGARLGGGRQSGGGEGEGGAEREAEANGHGKSVGERGLGGQAPKGWSWPPSHDHRKPGSRA